MKLIPASEKMTPEIEHIFKHSPSYFRYISGQEATPEAAKDTLTELPPGCGYHQKFVFLIELQNQYIGVSDLVLRYPDNETAFLGLLLLNEDFQGKGMGRQAYQLHEQFARENNFHKIRLAVVETNPVLDFWRKLGFQETGITRPYQHHLVTSVVKVLEKTLNY